MLLKKNRHKPRVLFNTLNSVINPLAPDCLDASLQTCENFLKYFIEKIEDTRSSIQLPDYNPSAPSTCSAVFNQFEPVSFETLGEIVDHLKPTVCHQDIIPTCIFKHTFSVIGPCVMEIINCCLASGSVPVYFKHAIVHPLIKKANLDPTVCSNFRPISKLPFFQKCWRK